MKFMKYSYKKAQENRQALQLGNSLHQHVLNMLGYLYQIMRWSVWRRDNNAGLNAKCEEPMGNKGSCCLMFGSWQALRENQRETVGTGEKGLLTEEGIKSKI